MYLDVGSGEGASINKGEHDDVKEEQNIELHQDMR